MGPERTTRGEASAAESTTTQRTRSAKPAAMPCGRVARFVLLLVAGATAGLVAFAGIDRLGSHFRLPAEIEPLAYKETLTREESDRLQVAYRVQAYQNTALQVAIFGAAAGGLLGLAAGAARRSVSAAVAGLAGGTVLGAAAGAIGGVADLYLLERLWEQDYEITYKSMAAHSAAFVVAGVGIGLAAGLAARRLMPTLGVVLAASLIAGLAYPGLAAYLFPITNTNAAVPIVGPGELLLWTAMPAVLMGLAVARTHVFMPKATAVP